MKRLLWLNYFFPPIGGAGVQRGVKFLRYLPEHGYDGVVVTGPGFVPGRWTPEDATLLDELPADLDVRRIGAPEPAKPTGWEERRERWLQQRSQWSRWWTQEALALGRVAVAEADAIVATMAPYHSAEIAASLSRDSGKPWIADLRDPWVLDEVLVYPTRLHRRRALLEMRRALSTADAIVMNTPEAANRLLEAFPELGGKRIAAIPNGFDRSDFERSSAPREDRAFRIVHTGFLHTELGARHRQARVLRRALGGAGTAADLFTRSHVYLLRALERLADTNPELAQTIEFHLAGVLSESDRAIAAQSPAVRLHGYLPHAESIDLLGSADLLFLPFHDLPPGVRATTVPGKTYEYLGSGRPILAAVPDGDLRDILASVGNAFLCRPTDVECMRRALALAVERFNAGEMPPAPDPEVVGRFERRHLTKRLAQVLDAVLASNAQVPGA